MLVNHVTDIKSTHTVGDDVDFSAVLELVRQSKQFSFELIGSKIHAGSTAHIGVPNLKSRGHKRTSNPLEVVPAVIILIIEAERLVQKLVKSPESVCQHDGKTASYRHCSASTSEFESERILLAVLLVSLSIVHFYMDAFGVSGHTRKVVGGYHVAGLYDFITGLSAPCQHAG